MNNKIIEDRAKIYGDIDESAEAISELAGAISKVGREAGYKHCEAFKGHLYCVTYKLSRFLRNPKHEDSWVDLINYLMFAWNSENKNSKFKIVFEKETP